MSEPSERMVFLKKNTSKIFGLKKEESYYATMLEFFTRAASSNEVVK